jgi:hypothetical protein
VPSFPCRVHAFLRFLVWGFSFHHLRFRSDGADVDVLALVAPILDFKGSKVDVGG